MFGLFGHRAQCFPFFPLHVCVSDSVLELTRESLVLNWKLFCVPMGLFLTKTVQKNRKSVSQFKFNTTYWILIGWYGNDGLEQEWNLKISFAGRLYNLASASLDDIKLDIFGVCVTSLSLCLFLGSWPWRSAATRHAMTSVNSPACLLARNRFYRSKTTHTQSEYFSLDCVLWICRCQTVGSRVFCLLNLWPRWQNSEFLFYLDYRQLF